jgi:hypothetical protein
MIFEEDFNFRSFYSEKDKYYWKELDKLIKDNKISIKTVLTNYMAFIQRRDLPQLLAYYELFKLVKDMPGSIAEVGVFIGNGLFTWTKMMETFFPGNRGKKVFGFDNFSGYSQDITVHDERAIEYIKSLVGDFDISYDLVSKLEKLHNLDSLIPGVERVKIYNDELSSAINKFKNENIGVRLKLLVVDVNLYKPTKLALEGLYDLVVPGGVIALRGYGVKPWEGESMAVDEFLKEKGINKLSSFDFSMYPSIYFRK